MVGVHVAGGDVRVQLPGRAGQGHVQAAHHLVGDLRLHLEDLRHGAVVGFGPDLLVGLGVHELGRDAHAAHAGLVALPAHGALEHVVHAQVRGDLLHGLAHAVVVQGAGPRHHAQAVDARQAGDDLVGDAGGEVGLLGGAEILEGEDHDHGFGRRVVDGRQRGRRDRIDAAVAQRRPPEHHGGQHGHDHGAADPHAPVRSRARGGRGRGLRLVCAGVHLVTQDLQVVEHAAGGLVAQLRILFQAAAQDAADLPGQIVAQLDEGTGIVAQHRRERRHAGLAHERPPARDHLVEKYTQGKHVRTGVDGLALGLFRRHVGRRAHHDALAGHVGVDRHGLVVVFRLRLSPARQAEVQHLHAAVAVDHHVLGLEIAVGDAPGVGRRHGLGQGQRQLEEAVEREAPLGNHGVEGAALHQFHDQDEQAVDLLDGVQRHDVGMVERGDGLRLALDAGAALGVPLQVGRQDLQGHVAVEAGVQGAVDLAHAALADEGAYLETANPLADHLGSSWGRFFRDVISGSSDDDLEDVFDDSCDGDSVES